MTSPAKRFYERAGGSTDNPKSTQAPEAYERNNRILIVEDEHGIAEAYKDILGVKPNNVIPISRSSRASAYAPAEHQQPVATVARPNPGEAFELTVVHSAEQALAEVKHANAKGKPFTMGFFDVLLGPGMDGIELVKRIHEIDSSIYAVFVTAYSDRSVDSIQALLGDSQTGRWDYLNKPFSHGEILQKARNGITLWNLNREKELRDESVRMLQRQLREHERFAIMALVARGIGHEFRNVMTTIIGKSALAGNLKTVDQLRETAKTILKASHRAMEILERFRHLRDPDAQVIVKKPIWAHEPLEETLQLLGHELQDRNIHVCWIKKKQLRIEGHATSLVQVYMNILLNAIQAMGEGGQIDLSVGDVGGKVEVRVRDFGPGVSPDIADKVMQPFFTTKKEGTGLGLAIVRDMVEIEHGGTLLLANHQTKGLEVVLTFPMAGETQAPVKQPEQQPSGDSGEETDS